MENKSHIDELAAQAAAIDSGTVQDELQSQAPAEPDNAAMFAAFASVTMGLLKAVRAKVAKGLPEIKNEWPDQTLQLVADAIPPVINKYLAKLMPLVGDYPEEGALAMACLPMVMGYVAAAGAAGKVANDKAKTEITTTSTSTSTIEGE